MTVRRSNPDAEQFMRVSIILDASFFSPLTNRSPASWRAWELLEPQIGLVLDANALLHEGGISKNSFQCPNGSSVGLRLRTKSEKRGDAPLSTQDRSSFMGLYE
jgi:hypothetical protein